MSCRSAAMSERIVPVDIDAVMRDPALEQLPDGPAKRLLTRLATELHHDPGDAVPVLLVRGAASGRFETRAGPT